MTKTHVIDGKTFVEVERKAKVGEYVINNKGTEDEEYFLVTGYSDEYLPSYTVDFSGKENDEEYTIAVSIDRSITIEPVSTCAKCKAILGDIAATNETGRAYCSARCAGTEVPANNDDLIANLVRRVHSLERQVDSLSTQLRDVQNNVERQGVEIADLAHKYKFVQAQTSRVDLTTEFIIDDIGVIIKKFNNGGAAK